MCVFIYLHFSLVFKGFFRVILGSQQNYEEGIEISHVAPATYMHCFLLFLHHSLWLVGLPQSFPTSPSRASVYFTHSRVPSSPPPLLSPFPGVRLAWGLQTLVQWLLCDSTV